MADFAVPDSVGHFIELFEAVLASGDPRLADDPEANRRLVLAGYGLGAQRADALGREMRADDVEYGLALLCKWPIKPEIEPALLDRVNSLRAEIVPVASRWQHVEIDPGALTLTLDQLYDHLGSEGPLLIAAYEHVWPQGETQGEPSTGAQSGPCRLGSHLWATATRSLTSIC